MTKRLWLALLVCAAYYAALVARMSFVVDGLRYFICVDDVHITMAYGRTLADTGVLAWYPGYTAGLGVSSMLWVWVSSLAWMLCHDPCKTGLYIQIFNGLVWLATLAFTFKTAKHLAGRRAAWIAFVLLAACWPLTNMVVQGWEFSIVALGVTLAYYGWVKRNAVAVILGLALCIITRYPLPNATPTTLKLTGYPWLLMLTRGAWMEAGDFLTRGLPVFALALLGCWWFKRWLPMVVFGAAVLFSVCVGGDVWHSAAGGSRWVLSTMPLIAVMAAVAVNEACGWFPYGAVVAADKRQMLWPIVAILCLSWTAPARLLLIEKPKHYDGGYQKVVRLARWIDTGVMPGTKIAVVSAGMIPWLAPGKNYYDLLGFNDDRIARLPAHQAPKNKSKWTFFHPGHLKYDPVWTVNCYRVDIIAQIWGQDDSPDEWIKAIDGFTVLAAGDEEHKTPIMVRSTEWLITQPNGGN